MEGCFFTSSIDTRASQCTDCKRFVCTSSFRPLFRPAIESTMLCLPVRNSTAIDHDLWALSSNSYGSFAFMMFFITNARILAIGHPASSAWRINIWSERYRCARAAQKLTGEIWILCEAKRIKPELFIASHCQSNIDLSCLQCDHGWSRTRIARFDALQTGV